MSKRKVYLLLGISIIVFTGLFVIGAVKDKQKIQVEVVENTVIDDISYKDTSDDEDTKSEVDETEDEEQYGEPVPHPTIEYEEKGNGVLTSDYKLVSDDGTVATYGNIIVDKEASSEDIFSTFDNFDFFLSMTGYDIPEHISTDNNGTLYKASYDGGLELVYNSTTDTMQVIRSEKVD